MVVAYPLHYSKYLFIENRNCSGMGVPIGEVSQGRTIYANLFADDQILIAKMWGHELWEEYGKWGLNINIEKNFVLGL